MIGWTSGTVSCSVRQPPTPGPIGCKGVGCKSVQASKWPSVHSPNPLYTPAVSTPPVTHSLARRPAVPPARPPGCTSTKVDIDDPSTSTRVLVVNPGVVHLDGAQFSPRSHPVSGNERSICARCVPGIG